MLVVCVTRRRAIIATSPKKSEKVGGIVNVRKPHQRGDRRRSGKRLEEGREGLHRL